MKSRKINALLITCLGFIAFSGFTSVAAITPTPVVASENKDTLVNLVTVNENAPVDIKYGTEHPIKEIITVINQNIKKDYEEFKYEGISELNKQRYTTQNSEVLVSNYVKNDFSLKEVEVEVQKKDLLLNTVDTKKYKVLVRIVDVSAPEITLKKETVTITKGTNYDPKTNVEKVVDKEDGNIEAFAVEVGSYDKNKVGEHTITVTAKDSAKNESKKTFKVVVKEPEIVRYATSGYNNYASYSYTVSNPVFAAPNLSHRAALNGGEAGNCTWYVYNRLSQLGSPIPYRKMGNGGEWAHYARSYGYDVSTVARAGSVWSTQSSYYGHVAFVEKVNADGSIVISEMNRNGLYSFNFRTVPASQAKRGYYIDFGLAR